MMFIIVLIAGTAAVTLADSRASTTGSHEAIGDLLCMLSAVIYGLYTVTLRWLLVDDKTTKMVLFFGCMGALIFCCLGPMLLLAWWIGFDLGTLSLHALGLVVAKGVLDNVLSDYLWARAILLIGGVVSFSSTRGKGIPHLQIMIEVGQFSLHYRSYVGKFWVIHASPHRRCIGCSVS